MTHTHTERQNGMSKCRKTAGGAFLKRTSGLMEVIWESLLPSRRRFDPLREPQHEGASSPNTISLGEGGLIRLIKNEQFFRCRLGPM